MKALLAVAIAACGSSSSPPAATSNEVTPKPVPAETRVDASVTIDAASKPARADDSLEPACDPDDPRCTAPLESGRNHPRADARVDESGTP